jgi:hypothetical protein
MQRYINTRLYQPALDITTMNFDPNAILRGAQLTLVGGTHFHILHHWAY